MSTDGQVMAYIKIAAKSEKRAWII